MTSASDSFLDGMVARRRADVAAAYGSLERSVLDRLAESGRPVRDFRTALAGGDRLAVIAEVKKASPSAGAIDPEADAAERASSYEAGGAAAISVLTEPSSFGGSFEDLAAVAAGVRVPVLCKDFVVDEAQVHVARGCGADALLLMISVLGEDVVRYLSLARLLGMEALVEVTSREELAIALRASAIIVGVNARDLHSLRVDPDVARALAREAAAAGVTTVLASGVRDAGDVVDAAVAGADAVLVGETLMRAPSPAAAVAQLAGVPRRGRGV